MKIRLFFESVKVAFFLAVKAITRGNIGVTLLTVVMLILVSLSLMFIPSLIKGAIFALNGKLVDTNSSNIIIEARGDSPIIRKRDELISRINALPGVDGVTYRTAMSAEVKYDEDRISCMVYGVSPPGEKETFTIYKYMLEGSYLDERDRGKILLGAQLAGADRPEIELYEKSLKHVHAGSKVTLTYANGITRQYVVKGIYYCQYVPTDIQAFVTDMELSSVTQIPPNEATSIHVRLSNTGEEEKIIEKLRDFSDDLIFRTWDQVAGVIQSMTESFELIETILNAVNILVAGFTVFIVTYIDLTHKRRQIGIERAIGITPAAIVASYVIRAIFYALISVVLMWFLYKFLIVPFEAHYPIHFPFGDAPLYTSPSLFTRVALIVTGVSIVAAFIPTWRAMKIKVLEAIWG